MRQPNAIGSTDPEHPIKTPAQIDLTPPYYVVTFAAGLKNLDTKTAADYAAMAQHMVELAQGRDGYLGHDSARGADGFGITNSYWRDMASIKGWRQDTAHLLAQKLGREKWYAAYTVHIAKVERAYARISDR